MVEVGVIIQTEDLHLSIDSMWIEFCLLQMEVNVSFLTLDKLSNYLKGKHCLNQSSFPFITYEKYHICIFIGQY